ALHGADLRRRAAARGADARGALAGGGGEQPRAPQARGRAAVRRRPPALEVRRAERGRALVRPLVVRAAVRLRLRRARLRRGAGDAAPALRPRLERGPPLLERRVVG